MTQKFVGAADIEHANGIYEDAIATIIDWMQWNIKVNMNERWL